MVVVVLTFINNVAVDMLITIMQTTIMGEEVAIMVVVEVGAEE